MKKIYFILLFLLLKNPLYSLDKPRIAIGEIKAIGVSRILAEQFTELISYELINSGKFIVIERSEVERVLKEQEFSMTGCTDVSCNVQIGKLVSATKILSGTISKLNSKFILIVKIIDVEKGVTQFAAKEYADSIETIDSRAVRLVYGLIIKMSGNDKPGRSYRRPASSGSERSVKVGKLTSYELNTDFSHLFIDFSFGGIEIYSYHPESEREVGFHALRLGVGNRLGIIGLTAFEHNGLKSAPLLLSLKIPIYVYPFNQSYEKEKLSSNVGGLFLKFNYSWMDTDRFEKFYDIRLQYDIGVLLSFYSGFLFESINDDDYSFYFGISLYFGANVFNI
jgi:TolB-like protein